MNLIGARKYLYNPYTCEYRRGHTKVIVECKSLQKPKCIGIVRQTGRQAHRQTDRLTHRKTSRQTNRQTDWQADIHTYRTGRLAGRQTDRLAD